MMEEGEGGICKRAYIYQPPPAGLSYPDDAQTAKFAEYLSGASPDTKSAYISDIRLFMRWARPAARSDFPFVSKRAVSAWVAHLSSEGPNLKNSTINRHLAGLAAFYGWRIDVNDLPFANPVTRRHYKPDRQKILPRPIPEDVLKKLFAGVTDIRDLAFYRLLDSSGCRLSGALGVRPQDVGVFRHKGRFYGALRTVEKGDKEHVAFFDEDALRCLCRYLEECPARPDEKVFRSHLGGGPLTRIGAQKRLGYWIRKLDLPHIHIHRFRHSFGTRMVENGMPVDVLQKICDHVNISTTQRYFKLSDLRTRKEFRKACERISKKK